MPVHVGVVHCPPAARPSSVHLPRPVPVLLALSPASAGTAAAAAALATTAIRGVVVVACIRSVIHIVDAKTFTIVLDSIINVGATDVLVVVAVALAAVDVVVAVVESPDSFACRGRCTGCPRAACHDEGGELQCARCGGVSGTSGGRIGGHADARGSSGAWSGFPDAFY